MELRPRAVENVVTVAPSWRGRRVFLTGHTGFKGGWLSIWLERLGARVYGYALEPPTEPSFFEQAGVARAIAADHRADVGDLAALERALEASAAEVVFHLAAQPLVRESYAEPLATLATNVLGTANVLEACRRVASVRAAVIITTDKVYENRNWLHPYRETDRLGGHDPYSASKAAAELVTASYRTSFFEREPGAACVATARAGNVIGGGDWAKDRLLPDCLRAFAQGAAVGLRNPLAVRPWQHVLEPLSGYLVLAERLLGAEAADYAGAWNFGPDADDFATVSDVARAAAQAWGHGAQVVEAPAVDDPPEMHLLRIDSTAARVRLPWRPRWSVRQAVEHTVRWHQALRDGADMLELTRSQIAAYESA